jgi:hypothetical protein
MPQAIPFAGTVGSWFGAGAATSSAAMGTGAMIMGTTAATAYTINSAQQSAKASKNAAADADARNMKSMKDLQDAQAAASQQAKAQIDERRRRMTASQTIFTNPLGLGELASTAKKSLLGL